MKPRIAGDFYVGGLNMYAEIVAAVQSAVG